MDVSRIANVISERINCKPQELLNSYVAISGTLRFEEFSNYCSNHGINITKEMFVEMLDNNDKYLFTESEDGWTSTILDGLESELGI